MSIEQMQWFGYEGSREYRGISVGIAKTFGIINIISGTIILSLDVVMIMVYWAIDPEIQISFTGVVTGYLAIITGILCMLSVISGGKRLSLIVLKVFSILVAMGSATMIGFAIANIFHTAPSKQFRCGWKTDLEEREKCYRMLQTAFITCCVHIGLGLGELVISAWTLILCCGKVCCTA